MSKLICLNRTIFDLRKSTAWNACTAHVLVNVRLHFVNITMLYAYNTVNTIFEKNMDLWGEMLEEGKATIWENVLKKF